MLLSFRVTLCASLGPAFATVIVYVALVPATMFVGPILTTERSAEVAIPGVAVEVLFPGFVSAVVVVTVAVFDRRLGASALLLTWNVNVKTESTLAAGKFGAVHEMAPVEEPTAGVEHVNIVVPLFWTAETNVVCTGTASVRTTLAAAVTASG